MSMFLSLLAKTGMSLIMSLASQVAIKEIFFWMAEKIVKSTKNNWDAEALRLRFELGDKPKPGGPAVVVVSKGAPPQVFREGRGCVVGGRFGSEALPPARGEWRASGQVGRWGG